MNFPMTSFTTGEKVVVGIILSGESVVVVGRGIGDGVVGRGVGDGVVGRGVGDGIFFLYFLS